MNKAGLQQDGERILAVFDFDGTLTTADTLLAFIRFTHGRQRRFLGLLRHAHWLLMMRMGLYPNWKAKQKVFAHFYKGTSHQQFAQWGRDFADIAMTMLHDPVVGILRQHQAAGHTVCVVTASIDEWVRPVCERLGIRSLIATRIEQTADGVLTGHFLSPNCYGSEKVARLLEVYPHRHTYKLYAYGDSRGDNELLAIADEGFRVTKKSSHILLTEVFPPLQRL